MESTKQSQRFGSVKSIPGKMMSFVVETMMTAKKVGKDDPRRIVHGMKVGLALTLVSMFYYFRPLYDDFGQAGMWAILTVVVVFEYTVGGTLSKSLNRGFATLTAGGLGLGVALLAEQCGKRGEPILLGLFVFVLAAASTFTRFFPNVKRRYDYGVLIFILTFTMVAVSGDRVTEIIQLAHQRISTIVIGGATCVITTIFVYPVWAGQDLHFLVAANIEKLAAFLEGFGGELLIMFQGDDFVSKINEDKSFLKSYKSVINSKNNEESLANFAWWEPPHGKFKFRHPWKQYLKVGALVRDCACLIDALNGYTNTKSQAGVASELQTKLQQACVKMSTESGKALRELAVAIKTMTFPSNAAKSHAQSCKTATDDLKAILENSPLLYTRSTLQEVMPLLVIASVLIDITSFVEKISLSVHELSELARFKNGTKSSKVALIEKQQVLLHRGIVKPVDDDCVVVEIINDGGGGGGGPPEEEGSTSSSLSAGAREPNEK